MPLLTLPIRNVGVVTDDSQLSAHTFTKQELLRSGSFDVNGSLHCDTVESDVQVHHPIKCESSSIVGFRDPIRLTKLAWATVATCLKSSPPIMVISDPLSITPRSGIFSIWTSAYCGLLPRSAIRTRRTSESLSESDNKR